MNLYIWLKALFVASVLQSLYGCKYIRTRTLRYIPSDPHNPARWVRRGQGGDAKQRPAGVLRHFIQQPTGAGDHAAAPPHRH